MIPTTREAAINALIDDDVRRWGEEERAAATRAHAKRSFGRALNELANRAELAGEPSEQLRSVAKRELTSDDRFDLRQGG